MITVVVKPVELWDEETELFSNTMSSPVSITLEHSLISISKWEAKWKQAFLGSKKKTPEMIIDYIRCMLVKPASMPSGVLVALGDPSNESALSAIQAYIDDPQTATQFANRQNPNASGPKDTVTSELIYSWIVEFGIDWAVEKWHIGRLLTLIHVCEIQNQRKERQSRENRARMRAANKARHAAHRR